MTVTLTNEPNFLVVTVSGLLLHEELERIQTEAKAKFKEGKKLNCLILANQFNGWGKDGDWGDLTFLYEADPLVEKIAVLTPEKWKEQILMFMGAGRRQALIEWFSPDQEAKARMWLNAK